jgi:hypothetical protein
VRISDLKALPDNFSDDREIAVSVFGEDSGTEPIMTYDIGFGENDLGEPTLQVNSF